MRDASGTVDVRWDPQLARFVFTGAEVDPVRFVFELAPDGMITGCVYEPAAATRGVFPSPPHQQVTYRPCHEVVGSRSD